MLAGGHTVRAGRDPAAHPSQRNSCKNGRVGVGGGARARHEHCPVTVRFPLFSLSDGCGCPDRAPPLARLEFQREKLHAAQD